MGFFVCNVCGASLKKNQVDKHWYIKCRHTHHVSCMDCNKDFWGQDYAEHTKCVSEDQKYGGNQFVAKENKGERKQEAWIEQIKERVADTKDMEPKLRELLDHITTFSNIPRKKEKFKNFLLNSAKIRNGYLVDKAWEVFQAANSNKINSHNQNSQGASVVMISSKRKAEEDDICHTAKKSKKKQKLQEMEMTLEETSDRKKKRDADDGKNVASGTNENNRGGNEAHNAMGENVREDPSKFKWKVAINIVLQKAPQEGMKISKLKKKIFSHYYASKGASDHLKSKEELSAKLNKILEMKNKYIVDNDRVKLRGQ
ncbi:cell growth-regulating nucleolar protein-like [Homarus americanus]|uniref:cell growth-regulating nucleolar protein-like n=1 Tax=Homarus americanus TaxID=6706 RepID=UPI001C45B2E3|nr:cell growth-regulating nucleolar protein-like [Homarus americanus]